MCFDNSINTKKQGGCFEILCAKCDGHLGHAFRWNPYKPEKYTSRTNQRHCVNSVSIVYVDEPCPNSWKETKLAEK